MKTAISIQINGKPEKLDAKEARRIYEELKAFLGETVQRAPVVIIDRQPVHLPPAPSPYSPFWSIEPNWVLPSITCSSDSATGLQMHASPIKYEP